jgi:hypothetical protein
VIISSCDSRLLQLLCVCIARQPLTRRLVTTEVCLHLCGKAIWAGTDSVVVIIWPNVYGLGPLARPWAGDGPQGCSIAQRFRMLPHPRILFAALHCILRATLQAEPAAHHTDCVGANFGGVEAFELYVMVMVTFLLTATLLCRLPHLPWCTPALCRNTRSNASGRTACVHITSRSTTPVVSAGLSASLTDDYHFT